MRGTERNKKNEGNFANQDKLRSQNRNSLPNTCESTLKPDSSEEYRQLVF